jgi:hypothetical protein
MTIASQQLKTVPSGEDGTNQKNYVQIGFTIESSADNLTAHAGGTQAAALPLLNEINRITTVASPADSVVLPKSVAGMTVMVINHGANAMQVFGLGTDTIDDVATATGVSQMPNSVVIYICATAGAWYTEGLATGYSSAGVGAFQTFSFQTLTASTTHTQAGATKIVAMQAAVTTANGSDAVLLPPSQPGMQIDIVNLSGANAMQVYASGSDTINGTAGSTGVSQAASAVTLYFCFVAGNWVTK